MTSTTDDCHRDCAEPRNDTPNEHCGCAIVDVARARNAVGATGDHAGLFSPYAVFVEPAMLHAMADVACAVFETARARAYIDAVLAWAPPLARLDPGSPGGVLGLDFHLTVDGPRLIEINTNPGGLLLNAALLEHAASCAPSIWGPPMSATQARAAGVDAWIDDLTQQCGRRPTRLAIIDEHPHAQFLFPEFERYAKEFRARGIATVIRAPEACTLLHDRLIDADGPIDAVYNRLTDFALDAPAHAAIAAAYRARTLALSPHPRAHALFADKRNLAVLGDAAALARMGVAPDVAARLAHAIPATVPVTDATRAAFWPERARYFFKPATGYGSRGSYRGDKLTRRAWDAMAGRPYVAQALVPPSVRIPHASASYKVDARCFASTSGPILFAARLYQGQTTNMRTPGGGFAAVLTRRCAGPAA